MSITIVNRFGKESTIKISKIREVLAECADGLNVNLLELAAHMDAFIGRDVVTTSEIQQSLIYYSVSLCDPLNTDYSQLAARLLSREITRNSIRDLEYDQYNHFTKFVHEMVKKGLYSDKIITTYSDEQLGELGEYLENSRDNIFDYAGMNILNNRYLLPTENIQSMFMVVSMLLAQNETDKIKYSKEFYDMVSTKQISLATPILSNLRKPKGNLSSCFITSVDDKLESIFNMISDISRISAMGGGVGINISRIRPDGSTLKGMKGRAKGIIPWIKIINDTMVAVDQGGIRAGAATVALDIWHYDVQEFLELQTENGDQRRKAYDIFPQLVIPDLFMQRVKKNEDWTLIDPSEILKVMKVDIAALWGEEFNKSYVDIEKNKKIIHKKSVNAKELFKDIMKSQIETGLPYLFFKDTVNRVNPNKHIGYIGSANLCVESFSNFKHSIKTEEKTDIEKGKTIAKRTNGETHICNLVSINLSLLDIENKHHMKKIHDCCVRILDNAIDITDTPVADALIHNNLYRVIGIGYMGYHDLLARRMLKYSDSAHFTDLLFESFALMTYKASVKLAKERGSFRAFKGSEYEKGIILGKSFDQIKTIHTNSLEKRMASLDDWEKLYSDIQKVGIRNSQCMAIAPNTSTSNLMGCSASILPIFSKFHMEKNSNGSVPIFPPYLKTGFWYYKENKHIDQKKVVQVVSNMQKWIDTGISMELLYNLSEGDISAKDIYDTIILAWEKGCKAIYYTRTIQKGVESNEKEACVSCAN